MLSIHYSGFVKPKLDIKVYRSLSAPTKPIIISFENSASISLSDVQVNELINKLNEVLNASKTS